MTKALYAGSFDPLTNGHLDIIKRATRLFDEVVVAVATNTTKKGLFTAPEKKKMIEEAVKDLPHVTVLDHSGGLTVGLAKELGASVMIRGIRTVKDYEYEVGIAAMNKTQDEEIETLFMLADPAHSFVSSTLVREVASFQGDVSGLVPAHINQAIKEKFLH